MKTQTLNRHFDNNYSDMLKRMNLIGGFLISMVAIIIILFLTLNCAELRLIHCMCNQQLKFSKIINFDRMQSGSLHQIIS